MYFASGIRNPFRMERIASVFIIIITLVLTGCERSHFVTSTGVTVDVIVQGTGPQPKKGQAVTVHYTGWLTDSTKFDSSVDRGTPFTYQFGVGQVIQGWDDGVATMKVGGKSRFTIPPELGYGRRGAGDVIPPNATLIFEVELLGVK